MDVSKSSVATNSKNLTVTELTSNIENQKYFLYLLESTGNCSVITNNNNSSLIVIEGSLNINSKNLNKFQGIHISSSQIINFQVEDSVKILFGSTEAIDFSKEINNDIKIYPNDENIQELSDYRVEKPWGFEIWYTNNLKDPLYALKRIHMESGFQSSLQSHEFKSETNFVVDGEALVLYGLEAPKNENEEIILEKLEKKIYLPFNGWSNKVNELHRVIAHTTYDAIEISTPELEDVIRWADDTNRSSGTIEDEHKN